MPDDVSRAADTARTEPAAAMPVSRRMLLAALAILAAFVGWEVLTSIVAYTDDAYVQSDLVAFAPEVTGHVAAVHVSDNQMVHRGDLLLTIDPVPFQLAVDARSAAVAGAQAEAQADRDAEVIARNTLAAAIAARDLAMENQRRAASLAADAFGSRQALDDANESLRRAQADMDGAQAEVDREQRMITMADAAERKAQAELATAEWELARTRMYAPVDGTINNLTVRAGDTARADAPLIGIVDAHAFRIVANYKQDYVRHFQPGGTAWVWLDSHPWHFYRARIEGVTRGISRGNGENALLPYVAPSTDWIRLQRRFPVTLTLLELPPDGMLLMGSDARVIIFP
jgi:multidrug efflux system membrane fusion protein